MTKAMMPGGLLVKDMEKEEGVVRGSIELVNVLRKFASSETTHAASGAF